MDIRLLSRGGVTDETKLGWASAASCGLCIRSRSFDQLIRNLSYFLLLRDITAWKGSVIRGCFLVSSSCIKSQKRKKYLIESFTNFFNSKSAWSDIFQLSINIKEKKTEESGSYGCPGRPMTAQGAKSSLDATHHFWFMVPTGAPV